MKNKQTLKVLGFSALFVIILTWLVPGTTSNALGQLELNGVNPMGLLSILGSFDILGAYFIQNSIIVLLVGALYGVINKTGALKELVDKVGSKFKGNENIFLIITVLLFTIIPAFTNIYFGLFVFIPLFMSILFKLGYNKNTALLSTVGAVLIGTSSQFSSTLFKQMIQTTSNPYGLVKIGFLVISIVLTVLYAIKTVEKEKEDVSESLIVPEKKSGKGKAKIWPIVTILSVLALVTILGLTSWNTNVFASWNTAIMDLHIGSFYIFKSILGEFQAFGVWSNAEFYTILITTTLIVGLVYKLKLSEIIEGIVEGTKKFIHIAIVVALINLIVIFTLNSGFLATIIRFIVSSGNIALTTLASIIGSPFVVDLTYSAQYTFGMMIDKLPNMDKNILALSNQLPYGITMLIAPTSTLLISGLLYLEKDYKGWFKYIWKLAVVLIILVFIAVTVATLI